MNFNKNLDNQKFNQNKSNANSNNANSNQRPKGFFGEDREGRKRNRKKKNNKQKNQANRKPDSFTNDNIEGTEFYDFRFKNKGKITLEDLMDRVKGRQGIELDFLNKLVIEKLNNDEESTTVKTIIKRLLDLLHTYQESALSVEEKSVVQSRGHLKSS